MGSTKKHDGNEWKKFGSTKAIDIKITDFSGNFESDNVEGALREASSKITDISSSVEGQKEAIKKHTDDLNAHVEIINKQTQTIKEQNAKIAKHEEDIAYLMENGGGGGGGNIAPTITSKFEDGTIVEKGSNVIIPIFFSSPNLGNGTAIIVIDGIEVDSVTVKAGNNNVNIGVLKNLNTEVSIYVKDRVGMLSNQLTWNIICGGIDLTVDFDSTADYSVTDTIMMQFNITSASKEPIIMHMTIDYDTYEVECNQGFNEYVFQGLTVGIHKISFYITSGPYKTETKAFNIVVISGESLYVSSMFTGGTFEFGVPIAIEYRISKLSTELFDVRLELDGLLEKSLSIGVGSYYWTLNKVPVGDHTYAIKVSGAYGEYMEITGSFTVAEGEYTPLEIIQAGLIYRLSGEGRTNNDSDRSNPRDNSGNGVKTTLHNFNYYTNGWINDALVCDGISYVEIDSFPWSENAIYGSTIEIQYKGLDIGMFGARIFDYTDVETPYKGAYIDLEETTMKSLANSGKINLDADTWITVSFVIDRKNKFGKIFIDGICSRAFSLSDTGSGTSAVREDFSHQQKIFLNSRKGIDKFGACEIKDIRIYGRVLSDDEIIQNNIAQIKDLREQKEKYDLNYNNTTLPTIKMYGDTTNMTLETPVTMRIKYTSPNEDKYGQSFDLPYCQVNWQGTSSLQYVLKNFTARLKDENMADYYYSPYPNGVPETVFCFKCDYMESTHSRNAGLAKFVNECLYDEKNPAQLKDPNVRNSIDGFPTLLYINDELQGVYNFNLDRYSTNSFGYTSDSTLVYEVSANSDTTAGAFFKWTESTGKSKLDYYKSDFECLYPPTRAAGNDDMSELIRLIEWVNDSSDEDFKDNLPRYFNLQYLLRYFLYVYVVGAVDSLGKNMKLTTWDGLVWYPQVYDADTTIGLDNTGFLKFDMDIEMGDEGVFNTTGSQLWKRVQLLFKAELEEQYAIMRQKYFTVENMMKYILEEQILRIPATFYNIDMQTKYLNYGSSYLYALHGSGEHHIRKWLRERLIYCDTLFGYTVSTADYITLRSSKLGYVYLDIQTYIPMYVRVKWRDEANNTGMQVKRVARGETVRFDYTMPTATDQEIIVYAGYYLKSLGDVSNLQPTSMLIANASRLTEIECHSSNLINTDLSECTKLQRIDLSDSNILGTGIGAQPILNIQNCKYLRYCNCANTQLTAIYTMQQGGNLEELYYPKSAQIIQVTNQTYLKVLGIPLYCENLATVQITNCNAVEYIHYPFVEGAPLNFDVFKYVQDLSIINSLDGLTAMKFNGFNKLKTVALSSLYKLEELGFDDMLQVGDVSTITKVNISDCPLVPKISFNVSSDRYKVEFAEGGMIDISGLQSCHTLESNYSIKGLNKIILPLSIKNVYLSTEYGDGDNHLSNLWSVSAMLNHETDGFVGIDFLNLNLENFKMEGCSNLTHAINFYLTPINNLPNLSAFESLQGWVNFDKYIGDVRYMFKGINFSFDDFQIIFNTVKPQTDITGLFQNAIITKAQFDSIITKFPNANIYDYFLENSTIEEDYIFPVSTKSVVGAFRNCVNLSVYHENWKTTYTNNIAATGCYTGCILLPLDTIPAKWGGFDFNNATTMVYVLDIPTDDYTVTISASSGYIWNAKEGGSIDWGDGDIKDIEYFEYNNTNPVSHTYATAGRYTIRAKFNISNMANVIGSLKDVLYKVLQEPTERTMYLGAYSNCTKLVSVNLPGLKPTNVQGMFQNTPLLTEVIGIADWDVRSIANLNYTFYNTGLTDYSGIESWNVSNCSAMVQTFAKTKATSINLSAWKANTITNINGLCANSSFKTIDISNWDMTKLTNVTNAFSTASLTKMIMNNVKWVNPSMINSMLITAPKLTTVVMDSLHPSVTNFANLFANCKSLTHDIALPITTTDATKTFYNCSSIKSVHSNWLTDYYSGAFEIPAEGWWLANTKLSTTNGTMSTASSHSTSPLLELNATLTMSSQYTASHPYMSAAGYNADGVFVSAYDFTNNWWIAPNATQYDVAGKVVEIVPREDIKYIRISAASAYAIWATINFGIPSVNCYSGCTGITSIDDVETRSGLDRIPTSWGGYDFMDGETAEIIIDTTGYANTVLDIFQRANARLIDWGDGTVDMYDGVSTLPTSHTYTREGIYTIKARRFNPNSSLFECGSNAVSPKTGLVNTLIEVVRLDNSTSGAKTRTFRDCTKLKKAYIDYRHMNISGAVNLSQYFYGCTALEEVTLNMHFPNYSPGGFQAMFRGCSALKTIHCNDWFTNLAKPATANLTLQEMFYGCSSLTGLAPFKNTSKTNIQITSLISLCHGCSSLTDVSGLDKLDVSNNTTLQYLFYNCSSIEDLSPITNWNTSSVTTMQYTFTGCSKLSSLEFLRNWDLSSVSSSGLNQSINNVMVESLDPLFNSSRGLEKVTMVNVLLNNNNNVRSVDISCLKNVTFWMSPVSGMTKLEELTIPCQGTTYSNALVGVKSLTFKTVNFINATSAEGKFGPGAFPNGAYAVMENLYFENVILTEIAATSNLNLQYNLTVDSLLNLFNALKDYSGSGKSQTIKLGSTLINKLTADQKAIAINKGWTLTN
jgi:surface protein